ncbi:MAG: D-aminoacylase [Parcubacteria group bacterium]|jgi:N-acyl-D-amino-acid deacylase
MFDILIKNGTVIDGTGKAMYRADVGIKEDKISKIGELHNEKGRVEIEAYGKMVCPGFIDVNNHSDTYWQLFLEPDLPSLLYQGITTIVGGNCGSSLSPLADASTIESIQKWIDLKKISVDWLREKEFFASLSKRKISVNFATLVGHATLRRGILKNESRSLNRKELNFIKKLLLDSMKEGAMGMSTGLVYTHARMASREEIIELAEVVAKSGGVYTTHVRGEKEELISAIEEAVEIGDAARVKVHISHLKAMGKKNWPKMIDALAIIDNAKKNGIDITFDVYPYTATGSVLYTLLPSWVAEGGKRIMIHRLKDPVTRKKVITEMKDSGFDYDQVEIAISPLNKTLARRKITEIAKSQEKSAEEAIIDILIASEGRVISSMEVLSEENVKKAIKHPLSIISTNGSGYSEAHRETGEVVHPRCFGAFTKVLEDYVKKQSILSWEEAIKKMTSMPAEKFGIKKRGILAPKYFADINIIDPEKLSSPATKENPYQYSKGIDAMLVNGKVVISDGKYTGSREGKIIKR